MRTAEQGSVRRLTSRLPRNRLVFYGTAAFVTVLLLALFAPLLTGHDPETIDLASTRLSPDPSHWLGTDDVGYDVWSRLLFGLRTSMIVGFGAISIAIAVGTLLGLVAGYFGGSIDQVLSRFIDIVQTMPSLLVAIVVVSIVGPGLTTILFAIGFVSWPEAARLVRGQVLSIREANYITAARLLGVKDRVILRRHVLPGVLGPLSVAATFGAANAVLMEASLSFVGLGVRPPTPSLGSSVSSARSVDVLTNLPWVWVPPAIAIAIVVLAVNVLGDGLRDAVDPRVG